jgi:hypothetical protein
MCLGRLDEAMADMKQLLTLEPGNKAAMSQIAQIKDKQKTQDNKDKKVFAKMFGSSSKPAAPKPAAESQPPKEDDKIVELGDDTRMN